MPQEPGTDGGGPDCFGAVGVTGAELLPEGGALTVDEAGADGAAVADRVAGADVWAAPQPLSTAMAKQAASNGRHVLVEVWGTAGPFSPVTGSFLPTPRRPLPPTRPGSTEVTPPGHPPSARSAGSVSTVDG